MAPPTTLPLRVLPILTTTTRSAISCSAATATTKSIRTYSSYSSRHENDPEKLDGHKQASLREQKDGKGQWREELASDAEAFIKAERQEIKATGEEIKKLQEETNKLLHATGVKA